MNKKKPTYETSNKVQTKVDTSPGTLANPLTDIGGLSDAMIKYSQDPTDYGNDPNHPGNVGGSINNMKTP
jgi:hypothetical protein